MTFAPVPRYRCDECGWTGDEPSISDASVERELEPGVITVDRRHVLICPRCFEELHAAVRPAA